MKSASLIRLGTRFGTPLVAAIAACLMVPVGSARAEVTRVVVTDSGLLGTFGGREYTWVNAHMEGTVARDDGTTGHYRVPISLSYPDRDSNGFGFVDVVNNVEFRLLTDDTAPFGRRTVSYPGNVVFGDYLRGEGFAYIAVQWSRLVTEALGPEYGKIENGLDGYQIIRDAAHLLRDPAPLSPDEPRAVPRVIGYGHSSSSRILMEMAGSERDRENADGSLVFEGLLLTGLDAEACRVMNNDETPRSEPGRPVAPTFQTIVPCSPFPSDGPQTIAIRTQTEYERTNHALTRESPPNLMLYDVAGVAHLYETYRGTLYLGASHQNPASWQPVARAMLNHLVDWIVVGTKPPPPLFLEGTLDDDTFGLAADADGNALGGIRLPHMATLLANGERAGAPLGVYGGVDLDLDPRPGPNGCTETCVKNRRLHAMAWLGGTFEPFPPEELARRYPTREVYVDQVRRAADALLADGYILQEDRDAYVRAAERQPLAPTAIDPFANIARVRAGDN